MSEPRIGRVLVASLHQAIGDVLPDRLEFYENWLSVEGLREGTIGIAPLLAVLSFLRSEGGVYEEATRLGGEYAAQWTVAEIPRLRRGLLTRLPALLRTRSALKVARRLVRSTYPGSRAIIRLKGNTAVVDLRGSLFCEVREASASPLCGYYAAAIGKVLQLFEVPADVQVMGCRSSGAQRGCTMSVAVGTSVTARNLIDA